MRHKISVTVRLTRLYRNYSVLQVSLLGPEVINPVKVAQNTYTGVHHELWCARL